MFRSGRQAIYGQAELEGELFRACEAGDVDRVRRAIAAGVDPKKAINKDLLSEEETPLHTACEYVFNNRRDGWYIDPPPHLSTLLSAAKNYMYYYYYCVRSSRCITVTGPTNNDS